jgi:hypothetical protein
MFLNNFFFLICSMLNKLSNDVKITKNGALQREIWRPEIGLAARVPHSHLVARGDA